MSRLVAKQIAEAGATWARDNLPTTVNVYEAGSEEVRELPSVLVEFADIVEQAPPLRGHYEGLLSWTLRTAVEDTSKAAHDALADLIEGELLEQNSLCSALAPATGTLFDLRNVPGVYEEDDNLRAFTCGAILQFSRSGIPPALGVTDYLVAGADYLVP